ncbi:MAG: biopolymer transport protein ExbD [Verrucomicrobiota bacterium]|jgi:biopolymer transport protein ExbD|nr:biopolymer transport protein ExbD [Verrucomicrobiota bacterium]MDK2964114.1 biopolymer transport protein ExbD [Verrucomicrobiota bacterium]
MGRFRDAGADDGADVGVDMSPLMDCVFILLIFFIVTTTFVDETGVEVDKPQAASSVQLEKTSILIALTEKGEVVYGGREIGISGVQPLVKRMLQKEDVPVIIQADAASQSGMLVRIIDEAKLGGAAKVSLASRKPKG